MGIRDRLRSSLRKDSQRKAGIWHSKAYHRFFEGYAETMVPKDNGKGTRIQRIYTGNYFRQELTKHQRILLRALYIASFLCVSFLYTSGAVQPLTINTTWYVVLPEATCLIFLFWILITLFSYLPADRDMTIDGFRSSSLSLKKATIGCAVGLGITTFATLIFILQNPTDEPQRVLLCSGYFFTGGLIAWGMNWIERKVKYGIIPSQNRPSDNSHEITD